jgi:hypothetical protein
MAKPSGLKALPVGDYGRFVGLVPAAFGRSIKQSLKSKEKAMVKRLSSLVLAGLLVLPTAALAVDLEDRVAALEEKQESWDLGSRIQFNGDFRFRMDYISADAPAQYSAGAVAANMWAIASGGFGVTSSQQLVAMLPTLVTMPGFDSAAARVANLGPADVAATDYDNDTVYTNRFRLNMRAKAMENLEFKARLAMYKVWGMQSGVNEFGGPFTLSSLAFDGSAARQPEDSILRVDRAFMNWNNIGGAPVWFSIGRRPVTDGPPAHIRMGLDEKMATPVAYMDYPFDGLSLGYAYNNLFGIQDLPGRVRLCYGRGFEAGPKANNVGLNDVDFGGLSWDVFKKGNRFFNFQSFGAFNMFNVPGDIVFPNVLEMAAGDGDGMLNRTNLGDIIHTSAVYMSKVQNLNYFVTLGWSRTNAKGMDEMGNSLLGSWGAEPEDQDGYSTLVGVRYDLDGLGLKLGAEYNWGSEYWISFTPGHDDLYASKLATRGSVFEVYGVYDIPAGEKVSKFSDAFFRFGYQHYEYDYTGSGYWLGAPADVDELANDPLNAQLYPAVESADQVYLTMEVWF